MARTMHSLCARSDHDNAPDHHVIAGLDKAAAREFASFESTVGSRSYDLDQSDAGPVVYPAHDRGIASPVRGQCSYDRRFEIVVGMSIVGYR